MGQYFIICNTTKKEMLDPHAFGDGLKLLEFGLSGCGTMAALALLLRSSDESGGGDIMHQIPHRVLNDKEQEALDIIGSWANDRIVIVGDYDSSGKHMNNDERKGLSGENLYDYARKHYKDVSLTVRKALCFNEYLAKDPDVVEKFALGDKMLDLGDKMLERKNI